jgi:hypothetical protein
MILTAISLAASAQILKPEDTEQWSPVPPIVTSAQPLGGPPSDAIVLLAPGANALDAWMSADGHSPARWDVSDGVMTVRKGTGSIQTKRVFGNFQLHLEWRIPTEIHGSGQARGNSGVFLGSTGPGDAGYELQILDSYRNDTYVNGQAGAVYKQYPPLANAMRPPGEWQVYDIVWTAPKFASDGSLVSPARVTAFHNGVLIQNDVGLRGNTLWQGLPKYEPHGRLPVKLQDHGDPSEPISFRNIWIRDLPDN